MELINKSRRENGGLKRATSPLRRILKRYPEGFHVREMLECGHWFVSWDALTKDRESGPAKRRRCHECRDGREVEPVQMTVKHTAQVNLWQIESGTIQPKLVKSEPNRKLKLKP